LVTKLRLLINPKEEDHERLADLTERVFRLATGPERGEPKTVRQVQLDLTACTQGILKREWERVKRGR